MELILNLLTQAGKTTLASSGKQAYKHFIYYNYMKENPLILWIL